MNHRFKKRGSLSLSMNAIVVIILAMAMIGVGLFFINSLMTRAEAIPETETWVELASSSNPIVFYDPTYQIKKGASKTLFVSLYNTGSTKQINLTTNCGDIFNLELSNVVLERTLSPRTENQFKFILEVNETAQIKNYICTFTDNNDNTYDLEVEVTG